MKLTVKQRGSDEVIAQGIADQNVRVFEGNWYFTPDAVTMDHLRISERTYTCPYKGVCYWIDLETPSGRATSVGWIYREPKTGYEFIKDQFGFYARDTASTTSVKERERIPVQS